MLLLSSARAVIETPPPPVGDYFLNPFVADSAHHRPIGTGAVYSSASHPAVVSWRQACSVGVNSFFPFNRVVFRVNNTSPTVTVTRNPLYDSTYTVPAGGLPGIPIPASGITDVTTGRGDDDAVVVFINTDTGEIHEFRGFDPTGSGPPFFGFMAGGYLPHWARQNGSAGAGKTAGLGHGVASGDRVGHSAAGVSSMFGVMRGHEMAGTGPILHVQQISLPRRSAPPATPHCANMLSRTKVLPASSIDGTPNATDNQGNVVYGGVMAIPQSVNLNTRGFTALQLRVAKQYQDFGVVPIDGAEGVKMRADQAVVTAHRTAAVFVFNNLLDEFRYIENGAWDPSDRRRPTGGGTPVAPNSAIDA